MARHLMHRRGDGGPIAEGRGVEVGAVDATRRRKDRFEILIGRVKMGNVVRSARLGNFVRCMRDLPGPVGHHAT
jgi:hypothetical protein